MSLTVLAVLGSLGGLVAFIGSVLLLIKAIFKQIEATKDNTESNIVLTRRVIDLSHRVDKHEIDIAVLKDRNSRNV